MKRTDFEAVRYHDKVFCADCLPDTLDLDDDDVVCLFADTVMKAYPVCAKCKKVHRYVSIEGQPVNQLDADDPEWLERGQLRLVPKGGDPC